MHTARRLAGRGSAAAASLALVLSVALSGASHATATTTFTDPCGTLPAAQHPATYKHVVWIIFENKSVSDIIGDTNDAPYLNYLSQNCGYAADYYGVTHKSFPNYVAQLCACGGINGIPVQTQPLTWKVYAESMNKPCYKYTTQLYLRNHNATTYFQDQYIPATTCQANDVPLDVKPYKTCPGSNGVPLDDNIYGGNFMNDVSSNSLPQLSVIIPSQAHNMKGCYVWSAQIRHADRWLVNVINAITSTPDYQSGQTTIFITWDEGWPVTNVGEDCLTTLAEDCHMPTMVVSPYVGTNTALGQVNVSSTLYSHYSLLRTTEEMLGLGYLTCDGSPHGPECLHIMNANSMRAGFNI